MGADNTACATDAAGPRAGGAGGAGGVWARACRFGMAAPYAWIAWFLTGPAARADAGFLLGSPYPGFVVASALICAAALLGARRGRPALCGPGRTAASRALPDAAATVLLLASSVLACVGAAALPRALAALLGGAGMAWMYARWLSLYARLDLRGAVGAVCGSVALAAVLKVAAALLPQPAEAAFGAVLALLGGLSLAAFDRELGRGPAPAAGPGAKPAAPANPDGPGRHSLDGHLREELSGMAVALAALCFVLGVAYNVEGAGGAVGELPRVLGYAPELVAALALWAWVCRMHRSLSAPGICCILAIVIATGLLALAAFGARMGMPMFVLLNVDHSLLTMFLWVVLVDVAQRSSADPMAVASAGWGLRSLLFVAGGAVAEGAGLSMTPLLALALVYVLLVALVLAVVGSRVGSERILARLVPQAAPAAPDVETRCARLARDGGLTPREAEILVLLCRGRSRPYIAETLYLSENTVRNHVKHIYEKLDIHDRQSLLSLVGDVRPEAGHAG